MEIVSGSPTILAPPTTRARLEERSWSRGSCFCLPVGRALSCQLEVHKTSGHDLPTRPKERWAARFGQVKSDAVGAVGRVVRRETNVRRCRFGARI